MLYFGLWMCVWIHGIVFWNISGAACLCACNVDNGEADSVSFTLLAFPVYLVLINLQLPLHCYMIYLIWIRIVCYSNQMLSLQLETEGRYYIVALVCLDWNQTLNNYITCKVSLAVKYSSPILSLHLRRSASGFSLQAGGGLSQACQAKSHLIY